eukprot:CAMPEP_0175249570 /NCGR_PEP_ID=MMETSP0093-20121207/34711_1 /TAXON_ID=311494 /ORGANISM="Alexandrium monilatum, Strain CCMP3105" /LENGTH=214 /DNA_ID=CAMNT_0016543799 /DNA_START=83 /DNA_END=728 /DNA_ORIENTATION=-
MQQESGVLRTVPVLAAGAGLPLPPALHPLRTFGAAGQAWQARGRLPKAPGEVHRLRRADPVPALQGSPALPALPVGRQARGEGGPRGSLPREPGLLPEVREVLPGTGLAAPLLRLTTAAAAAATEGGGRGGGGLGFAPVARWAEGAGLQPEVEAAAEREIRRIKRDLNTSNSDALRASLWRLRREWHPDKARGSAEVAHLVFIFVQDQWEKHFK